LIDKSDSFFLGFSKFDVLFGRKVSDQIKSYYRDLPDEIDFRQEQIESFDPQTRHVNTQIFWEAQLRMSGSSGRRASFAPIRKNLDPPASIAGFESKYFYATVRMNRLC
jgi:hypothetical protein